MKISFLENVYIFDVFTQLTIVFPSIGKSIENFDNISF